jgi:hypothetical protein
MPSFLRHLVTVALMSMALISASPAADGKPHRIAIQVDENDPQLMNMALGNASKVIEYYRDKNEDVEIDIVAYGPGLHMLRADTRRCRIASGASRIWYSRARSSFRLATTPSKEWRRRKAMQFPFCPTPPSFPPASFT